MANQRQIVNEGDLNQDQVLSPSVSRAVQIIEFLSQGSSSFADLSKQLNIPKSSLHGILSTLEAHQWIEIKGRKISQGQRLFQTVVHYSQNAMLKPIFEEVARRLVTTTGETTFLGILEKHQILHIARVDGTSPLRYVAKEGEHAPAHASALGKVLLAEYKVNEVRAIFEAENLTAKSIPSLNLLLKHLPAIREQGYALDQGEVIEGLHCVAAPIWNASKQAIASMALAAPEFRFVERENEYIRLLCEAAAEISARLGYVNS